MANERRSRRRWWWPTALAAVSVVSATLTGCSVEAATPAPSCSAGGSMLIVAQSVASASQVPCVESLPNGWSVATVSVNQERTEIVFDSDRAGSAAAVLSLGESCDVSGAIPSPSEFPLAERFDEIQELAPGFRAMRFYRFDGGCVTWTFEFDDDASATEAVGLGDAVQLIPRRELSDQLRETFVGEGL